MYHKDLTILNNKPSKHIKKKTESNKKKKHKNTQL